MNADRINRIAENVSSLVAGTLDHDATCQPRQTCRHWNHAEMTELIACALEVELEESE